jgi:hypothetical protein
MGGDIDTIESRFREVTCLPNVDLSQPCIPKSIDSRQKTSKEETKILGYVPTPLWLVDEMLEPEIDKLALDSRTCDACAGCGQFTIRMMRKLKNKYPEMDVEKWLSESHYFTEFQFSNVARLIYIFGPQINVYVGDSLNMKYAKDEDKGLVFFNEKLKSWVNIPNLQPEVEKRKDSLSDLITFFGVLESGWGKVNSVNN